MFAMQGGSACEKVHYVIFPHNFLYCSAYGSTPPRLWLYYMIKIKYEPVHVKVFVMPKFFTMTYCMRKFYEAVHVEMFATPTCFSMRQCTWKCSPLPRAFLWGSTHGNVRHSHMLFYKKVNFEMLYMRKCTWKCTPFPHAFLWGSARRNVCYFHVFFFDAVHVEMYAIPIRVWHQCNTPVCFPHVTVNILVFSRAYVAMHVEVRHPYVSFLRCQLSVHNVLSHVAVHNSHVPIYVAARGSTPFSYVCFAMSVNIPMCFSMLQCKFKGTVSRDFLSWISFPPAPEIPLRPQSNE
jgi:hypothetical protein